MAHFVGVNESVTPDIAHGGGSYPIPQAAGNGDDVVGAVAPRDTSRLNRGAAIRGLDLGVARQRIVGNGVALAEARHSEPMSLRDFPRFHARLLKTIDRRMRDLITRPRRTLSMPPGCSAQPASEASQRQA